MSPDRSQHADDPINVVQENEGDADADADAAQMAAADQAQNGAVMPFDMFVSVHRTQLETSCVPQRYWRTLYTKLTQEIFDAGSAFAMASVEDDSGNRVGWQVLAGDDGIQHEDEQQIYLIDHAWTFSPQEARSMLLENPMLLGRMASLMDLPGVDEDAAEAEVEAEVARVLEAVMKEKWRLAQTYSVPRGPRAEDRMPVWYIMDEFGSRIQHSDGDATTTNVRVVPFLSGLDGCAFSLMFPVRDVGAGEEVKRDWLEGPEAQDDANRRALNNTWREEDMTGVDWAQEEPGDGFFGMSRQNESLPAEDFEAEPLPKDRKIRVYAEYVYVGQYLKHPRFEMVESHDEADILWHTKHIKLFKELSELSPSKRVNQFPYESVLTIKDLLCVVCRRMASEDETGAGAGDEAERRRSRLETSPKWLPATFNLKTELPQFVSYFQQRKDRGLDNHWIVKPWNLARGLDTHISSELSHILRLPFSGPKIAQKYLSNPVLFDRPEIGRVKFDIRYVVLLHSVHPLKAYVYDRFWLRFANRPFELNELDEYEKHFTVMNYDEQAHLQQMDCRDFVPLFESQYPSHPWPAVQQSILGMLRSALEGAAKLPPPSGLGRSPQSRALYAADLMLDWTDDDDGGAGSVMQPKLLEFNMGPDCQRACEYYPEFYDNVFSTLFLDEPSGQNVTLITE